MTTPTRRADPCPSGKIRYGRQETALTARRALREKGRFLSAYKCSQCDGYHLGHKVHERVLERLRGIGK
jgi:hypothetical protein